MRGWGSNIERIILSMVVIFTTMGSLHAQSLDSLLSAYEKAQNDNERLSLLINLASICQSEQAYSKAIEYYKDAIELGNNENRFDEVPILKSLAFCYNQLKDYEREGEVYNELLKNETLKTDRIEYIKILKSLADVYVHLKSYEEAIDTNLEIIKIANEENNHLWTTLAYNNLGFIYNAIGETDTSIIFFNKGYELIMQENIALSDENKAAILINMGVSNASIGRMSLAQKFLNEALELRKKSNNPLKIAQTLNYLAAYELISNKTDNALKNAKEAIDILTKLDSNEEIDNILVTTYKVMTEVMLKKNDIAGFKLHYKLYSNLQEDLMERERKSNKLLLDYQLNVERKASEISLLLTEKEKEKERQEFKLRQTQLEQDRSENELKIKLNEIEMLKQQQEMQNISYRNQQLEKDKVEHLLALTKQQSEKIEQKQLIDMLQKDKELQDLQIAKRKNEIELLEKEKELGTKNIMLAWFIVSLLVIVLIFVLFIIRYRIRKSRELTMQNSIINNMNSEIMAQNDELSAINDQLNFKTIELDKHNKKLTEAQSIIKSQNEKLKSYNNDLEREVKKQTKELRDSNNQLLQYNTQLEQFTYAISHNIRAPIARLLGLTQIFGKLSDEKEKSYVLSMVKQSSEDLDDVVNDLHSILEIKTSIEHSYEEVDLKEQLDKVKVELGSEISEANALISADFSQATSFLAQGDYFDDIFRQLISNSLKFRNKKKKCLIEVCSTVDQQKLTVVFKDNGLGIDLEQFGHQIFGLYKKFTLSEEGKGIGLYVVKSQIEKMGGVIKVESEPGEGVIFYMIFPLEKPAMDVI
ncbi:tetratricopeptide repeat protein [Marivirga sp. S37H4]|uniref:histidine kinase n=1 Tax=Marivirga aurantiaca TaxID=2802615 RepID=A0A935C8X3_9BACT|nr:tetratricopeptide repeat-containing sensor histidine kinase [Marivirga aurantiaca]MBK6265735.1 tetratricopeptide repeat protein [Marivirga aurantiaca]